MAWCEKIVNTFRTGGLAKNRNARLTEIGGGGGYSGNVKRSLKGNITNLMGLKKDEIQEPKPKDPA